MLAPLYTGVVKRFPAVGRAYRAVAHREARPPFRRKFAVGKLHEAIKREFGNRRGGVFLEAGANDGLLFSNTAFLERYCGWSGLLIEAVPHKFVECVHNRPGSIVEHCALVGDDFDGQHVEIRYSDLMSYAPALTKIDKDMQLAQGNSFLSSAEQSIGGQLFLAPARTLKDVLAQHKIRRIDLMVLDLEGAELSALCGLDFKQCDIDNLLIEVRDLQATDDFLGRHGFQRKAQFDHHDYFYQSIRSKA